VPATGSGIHVWPLGLQNPRGLHTFEQALNSLTVGGRLVGVGMSDWEGYANRLEKKLSYVNTYYHKAPLLDITAVDPSLSNLYDFIIATEVFEHISPPISRAFENVHRLLKPGGVFIFSVPS